MKKILLFPFRIMDGLADRIISIAGAVGLAQFPQFFAQYLQRLGGHLEEARLVITRYRAAAESLDLTLEEYLAQHLASGNEIFVSSGQVLTGVFQRLTELEEAFRALQQAGPFTRWWFFLLKADPLIIRETWRHFHPGLPTTVEGLIYGLAGLFLAWGLYQGVRALILYGGRKIGALLKPGVKPGRPAKPGLPM
ncbi:MAG: DUF2937 family protein [Firmicutes bacterium]|nr:DUF2937 family protein [Bacillota bacterium]